MSKMKLLLDVVDDMRRLAESLQTVADSIEGNTDAVDQLDSQQSTPQPEKPNPEMTSFIWRETMLSHLLLWGNSYSQIIRTGRNGIVGLYPLLPDHMNVDRNSKGVLTYTYTTSDGKTVQLDPDDVLHIPGLGFDGVVGYSPIALEKNAIGLGIAAEEYGSKFFQNGARPSGVLTHPNTVKDPKRLRESWNAAYGGSSNSSKVAVLEEAMTFTPISMPNNEAQFLETRKFQVAEICRIYRVPPHLVGDLEHATFSNIEHQGISFAVHTIRPWLVRIEQSINRALFSDKEKYCKKLSRTRRERMGRRRQADVPSRRRGRGRGGAVRFAQWRRAAFALYGRQRGHHGCGTPRGLQPPAGGVAGVRPHGK